jgi:hypothetical protein
MLNIFNKQKNEIIIDTNILKNLVDTVSNEDIIDSFDKSWYLPILHYAIDNNDTSMIHKIVNKNKDKTNFIDETIDTNRDKNRLKLLKVFFKKLNLNFF